MEDDEARARSRIEQDNRYRNLAEQIVAMVPTRTRAAVDDVAAFLTVQFGYGSPLLTLTEAGNLAEIVNCMQGNPKVGRMIDGHVYVGEARSIGDARGNFDFSGDVRDQFLRVTLDTGLEAFWPVRDLMAEHLTGYFVPHYETPAVL